MAITEQRARQIAAEVGAYITTQRELERTVRVRLIVPDSAKDPNALSEELRARHERRIYFIANQCRAQWLIDQALDGAARVEALSDNDLLVLLKDCENALKCLQEGVSFMDAGLVRAYAD
jgi:hypothetical protein